MNSTNWNFNKFIHWADNYQRTKLFESALLIVYYYQDMIFHLYQVHYFKTQICYKMMIILS